MIVDVPSHAELGETALEWMYLGWRIAIGTITDAQSIEDDYANSPYDEETEARHHAQSFLLGQRFSLNNSISLLQLSVELLLKARLAEVSPYLLIVGDPQSWPRLGAGKTVSFSDFRTIDASQLCRAVNIACTPLPKEFPQFFERLRKHRNKIIHLHAGSAQVEAKKIALDVLLVFEYLFPNEKWIPFRRFHLRVDKLAGRYDWSHSSVLSELEAAVSVLGNTYTKRFFDFNKKEIHHFCPNCKEMMHKHDDGKYLFAKRATDESVSCLACGAFYSSEEYASAKAQWE